MAMVRASELAERLSVSRARVSQYVADGKLAGCYVGEGQARRFDSDKCFEALGRRLDPGQMMGNGAGTRQALAVQREMGEQAPPRMLPLPPPTGGGATELPAGDGDRYELARTLKAEEEARRLRRQNLEAEGTFVLAAEAARQTQRLIAQEVAEFETVLREASRRVADELGVDYKSVRQILVATWRGHRAHRSEALVQAADAADLTPAEGEADV
ncbi:hypothetical protein [Rubellimicrobium aerolatum]|uniref:Helix-turn-helix domain-containing protein n=1 Tax=Rubellimicrobium aerolatum TaxID=490979 RepID=A0ABW0SET8_9RHOB|nr:hypothetical protein [Rubellimicrobium aerolatum]MBP1806471.1 putative site-specific integrase-resolvase [Rubellimicrobium aerolatum]